MAQGRVCMAADVSVVAMTSDLGAEIRGVDLASPLSDACFRRILEAFHRYCVVFLRAQSLDPRLLVRLAARFGEPEMAPAGEQSIPGLPQVGIISDSGVPSGRTRYGLHWGTDGSYLPQPPLATLLYAIQCPPQGGSIEFVNLYSALSALPRQTQLFVEKLRAVHEPRFGQSGLDSGVSLPAAEPSQDAQGTEHPVVRVHPATRRKSLYLAKDAVARILGLAPSEGRKLVDELEAFATQPRFIYSHRWRSGDLIIWDNRCSLRRMIPFDRKHERILHRVQVRGEVPVPAAPGAGTGR